MSTFALPPPEADLDKQCLALTDSEALLALGSIIEGWKVPERRPPSMKNDSVLPVVHLSHSAAYPDLETSRLMTNDIIITQLDEHHLRATIRSTIVKTPEAGLGRAQAFCVGGRSVDHAGTLHVDWWWLKTVH